MNIALVNSEYPSLSGVDQGGIATYTYTLANALAAIGHRVWVVVRKGVVPTSLDPAIECISFSHSTGSFVQQIQARLDRSPPQWERGFSSGLCKVLCAVHAKTPLDIVEVPEYNGLAIRLDRSLPFKVVVNFHTPRVIIDRYNSILPTSVNRRWYALERAAAKKASGFRVPSIALQKEIETLWHIDASRIRLIRNPVDIHKFSALSRLIEPGKKRIDVFFAGRMERRKGAEVLLHHLGAILDMDERINLTVAGETQIGESTTFQESLERVLSAEQRQRVWFLGPIRQSELPIIYCRSDIFLLPSLFENSPNTLFEAMAACIPIVASRAGGIPETIHHEKNGLLFDPKNGDELLACIKSVCNDPQASVQRSTQAYTDVSKHHAPSVIAQQSIDFYQSILEAP